jgi:TRAP transporter 4TM/12TM fusion protein
VYAAAAHAWPKEHALSANQPGFGLADAVVTEAQLRRAEDYVEQEEGATHRFGGWLGMALSAVAVVMSLFHLYSAYAIVPTQTLRPIHVGFVLFLAFTLFPMTRRLRNRVNVLDLTCALLSIAIVAYMLAGGDDFNDRATIPNNWDLFFGVALMLLVLEAARRTTGWIMPLVVIGFIAYALTGPYLPAPWTHRGYDIARLTGHMYMTLEGIFGTAIDVSSSLIILFTIYGAVLQFSGAGKFFIDFSLAAMGGKATGAGRTVVMASFLLGGPSGSGVATTVTLGSVAYPMLAKSGYSKEAAGGLLAAGGLGAILSPPVLGAAAFLIAEFLKISYLDVILMATIPTVLYYFSILLMVELDARKFGIPAIALRTEKSIGQLTRELGFHFLSLVAIIAFMLMGFSPILAVFAATLVAFVVSALNPQSALLTRPQMILFCAVAIVTALVHAYASGGFDLSALDYAVPAGAVALLLAAAAKPRMRVWPAKLFNALRAGSAGMINVAATCAAAGMIVGVVTLTGLGLKFSAIVLDYADGGAHSTLALLGMLGVEATPALLADLKLLFTALFTSLIVWIVGLAVPVTASYIICAVIAAPALMQLGVPDFAAHMFIFYYAVLSEVSPPTALSPFAAAAITGGDPYKTTLHAWKYTAPAFLLPFMFVLDASGTDLLLTGSIKTLANASWLRVAEVTGTAMLGIAALAAGLQGWVFRRTTVSQRWLLIVAGVLLVYPRPWADATGIALILTVSALQKFVGMRVQPS